MQDQINYNIEDTGKLMTQSARGGRNKRKKLIISAVAAVLIVALAGGFFVIRNKRYEAQVAVANDASVEGYGEESVNSADAYDPVINEYKQMLAEVDTGKEFDAFDNENSNGFTYVFNEMIPHELNGFREPSYAIKDINGDGVDEMIVGVDSDGDSFVGSILTLNEKGEPQVVANCESFMYRGELNLYKDGTIQDGGSSGADDSRFTFYTLNGTGLDVVDEYIMADGVCSHNGKSMSTDKWLKETEKARKGKRMSLKWKSFR